MTTASSLPFTSTSATKPLQTTGSSTAAAKFATDMDGFLKLLTAQLRNQDPLAPLDANEFTAQLAQYSSVEQQIAANKNMEALLDVQRSNSLLSAASLVGQEVEVVSDLITMRNGTAQTMQLPSLDQAGTARQAVVTVTNPSGIVLRQSSVSLGSETTPWRWNGRDNQERQLADGTYKVAVTGVDAAGRSTGPLDFTLRATVDSVSRNNGDPKLNLGALAVGIGDLRRL
ncbi:flagellar hook assembly protein FlgD [Roseomonas sp. SSH11]|uniref:Basal-body rod modification protein FlgD n=1 Tax=Pararoseomonas baculiformis TaxID=2820812 RepID=A0ABS4AK38_9PROT|nr:flagellar hook assembly protein FlgD [Pararoseomonas baculiformis]MBP0447387.1 flagellar hook assembly protein FlgD [Pararoseomonas baculiformis]